MENKKEQSKTRQLAAKVIFEAFKILKDAGGEMRGKEVMENIQKNINFNEWESEVYKKSGYIRWQSILHFFTIDCIKAGFLRKNQGVWTLTKEGEETMKLGPVDLLDKATELYWKWADSAEKLKDENQDELELKSEAGQLQKANLEQLEDKSVGPGN